MQRPLLSLIDSVWKACKAQAFSFHDFDSLLMIRKEYTTVGLHLPTILTGARMDSPWKSKIRLIRLND